MKRGALAMLLLSMLLLSVPLVSGGCSLLTVTRTPPKPWTTRPDCTSSRSAVKRDFLIAGAAVVTGLVFLVVGAATDTESDQHVGEQLNPLMLAGGIMLIGGTSLFGGSGAYGYVETHKCRQAQAAFDHGDGR